MKLKIVSDTHFNHDIIIKRGMRKFDSLQDMNNYIIEKWNREIKPNDNVIHLGDFAFGNNFELIESICKKLNGNITLILGNHDSDYKVKNIYSKYFKCLGSLCIGDYYFTHEPVHMNVINPNQVRSGDRQATINIHGHLHNGEYCSDKHINYCMDLLGEDFIKELNIEAPSD